MKIEPFLAPLESFHAKKRLQKNIRPTGAYTCQECREIYDEMEQGCRDGYGEEGVSYQTCCYALWTLIGEAWLWWCESDCTTQGDPDEPWSDPVNRA
jgi:hypothetical protein